MNALDEMDKSATEFIHYIENTPSFFGNTETFNEKEIHTAYEKAEAITKSYSSLLNLIDDGDILETSDTYSAIDSLRYAMDALNKMEVFYYDYVDRSSGDIVFRTTGTNPQAASENKQKFMDMMDRFKSGYKDFVVLWDKAYRAVQGYLTD